MATTVTETDTYPTAISAPTPNDRTYPITVPQTFSDLASRTKWLRNVLMGHNDTYDVVSDTDIAAVASGENYPIPKVNRGAGLRLYLQNIYGRLKYEKERLDNTRLMITGATAFAWTSFIPVLAGGGAGELNWKNDSDSGDGLPFIAQQVNGAVRCKIGFPYLPIGARFNSINLMVSSPVSHGGSIAGMLMPQFSLCRANLSTTETTIASVTDSSASEAAYEAYHTISLTGLSEVVLDPSGYYYYLSVRGESSSNSEANSFRIYAVVMRFGEPE